MCKERGGKLAVLLAALLAVLIPGGTYGQGGDGRSSSPSVTAPAKARPAPRRAVRTRVPRPRAAAEAPIVRTGGLAVFVNERGSEVFLSRTDSTDAGQSKFALSGGRPLVLTSLEAGNYALTVKKYGFKDELRHVAIAPGKRRSVRVNLLPKLSVLTVATNVGDADIEIERVGKFKGALRKYPVKPGIYRIAVKRRGYEPQTVTADLLLPGREQTVEVVLQPLRVDAVLTQAKEKINSGDLKGGNELAGDVLKLNDAHGRANLLAGMAAFEKGDVSAKDLFFKAVARNEAVRLPVNLQDAARGGILVPAEMSIDRNSVEFKTAGRVELNFRIERSGVTSVYQSVDASRTPFFVIGGKGRSYGRPLTQDITIFSRLAAANSGGTACAAARAGRTCISDIQVISGLLHYWRSGVFPDSADALR